VIRSVPWSSRRDSDADHVQAVDVERVDRVEAVLEDELKRHDCHRHPSDEEEPAEPLEGPRSLPQPNEAGSAGAPQLDRHPHEEGEHQENDQHRGGELRHRALLLVAVAAV
jgi:hypothetical protein